MVLQVTELFSDHLERALAGYTVAAQEHAAEIRIRALGYVNKRVPHSKLGSDAVC